MNVLKSWLCTIFGYCPAEYNREDDHLVKVYESLEHRTNRLYWRPRDLLDIR